MIDYQKNTIKTESKMSKAELLIQLTKLVFGIIGLGLLIYIALK